MLPRLCLAVVPVTFVLATLAPGAAVADPKGTVIPSTCDDGHSIELALNGNGDFTPGHLVGGTAVYVVQSLEATQTFTPTVGVPDPPKHFLVVKPHVHGDLVTCHFAITVAGPDGVFHGEGDLVAFITPVS